MCVLSCTSACQWFTWSTRQAQRENMLLSALMIRSQARTSTDVFWSTSKMSYFVSTYPSNCCVITFVILVNPLTRWCACGCNLDTWVDLWGTWNLLCYKYYVIVRSLVHRTCSIGEITASGQMYMIKCL